MRRDEVASGRTGLLVVIGRKVLKFAGSSASHSPRSNLRASDNRPDLIKAFLPGAAVVLGGPPD